ncbi:hypothetical protein EUGRSUZ_J02965 [Eucalyptus grandis]|uniref:Uncharacterized protein n=1 Tax=Eucalyptus grandis TaxID=71139 RepID=A0ACC3JB91_EUCGR|nr:hypothetical protein EUGRSUZ_J02965 [Eucalyptus grandis]
MLVSSRRAAVGCSCSCSSVSRNSPCVPQESPPPRSNDSTSPPLAPQPATVVPPPGYAPLSNSPTSPPLPSPTPLPAFPNGGLPPWKLALIAGTGIGGLIVLIGVCTFVIFHRRKRRRLELGSYPPHGPKGFGKTFFGTISGRALGLSQRTFTYEELKIATDGFSNLNLLGEGGFGYVHKGVLSSGKVVAIKQLKTGSRQGEREFKQKMKIALGSARGLAYLHEECNPKIIHRDIKAANILLESNFEAKVADFGLAKFASDTDTHVSTRVMGTFGYLAPEYASSGNLTEKSDVFSFGVVLLELITGRRPLDRTQPFDEDSMVDWARPLLTQALEDGNFDAIVDPKLNKDYVNEEITRVIACAAACIRHSARHRPAMTQVVRALEGNFSLSDFNEGIMPGHGRVYNRCLNSDYDPSRDQEDSKNFRMMALESHEQATSEFSGQNSDDGLQPSSSSSKSQRITQETDLEHQGSTNYPRDGFEGYGRG